MILDRPEVRSLYKTPGPCEVCRKWCRVREPAHIWSAGAGRVDAVWNMIYVGSSFLWQETGCKCHIGNHSPKSDPPREQLAKIAAKRHGVKPADIEAAVFLVRRTLKGREPDYSSVSEAAAKLVREAIDGTLARS